MTAAERRALLHSLETRFTTHTIRHPGVSWTDVERALVTRSSILATVQEMERSGGEPDVAVLDDVLVMCDCSTESPIGRRSLCYDGPARITRKDAAPASSAVETAAAMGVDLMTESQY